MRFIVYGTGAVGGPIAAKLVQNEHDVVAVARGEHATAMARDGLVLETPTGAVHVRLPVVTDPGDIVFGVGDVVIISVKSQDLPPVLERLARTMPWGTPVVCAQNAVCNEPSALRLFPNVYGMNVMLIGTHLKPGVVQVYTSSLNGILDIGRYPNGVDDTSRAICAALEQSGFESAARPDIMRWKYGKLLMNLNNAIEVAVGPGFGYSEAYRRVRAEGEACLSAAGIEYVGRDEDVAHRGDTLRFHLIEGQDRGGGSTWQSFLRNRGSAETDYLNGEIVLLGRLHGIPTPANAFLQRLMHRMLVDGPAPGSMSHDELVAAMDADQ